MRTLFLGTPQFAVSTLERLLEAGHEVPLVVTQPDRPKGRGNAIAMSPVKEAALRHGLEVFQPERIRRPEGVERLKAVAPEIMVIVGYGQIIPQSILEIAPRGILNVHASLLPKYRGAAPIQWAIANGETTTGVTIMKIDAGLDTGDMLRKAETAIGENETAVELSPRLAEMGADLLVETIASMDAITPEKQDDAVATLAPILRKEDGRIDWTRSAREIHNRIRGLQPWPGAYTVFRGQALHIWGSRLTGRKSGDAPGTLSFENRVLYAAAGDGLCLELREVQAEGRKRLAGDIFANGARVGRQEAGAHDILGESKH
ncbi:MAG TPA: methionyl-tRNA formyltransferase [Bryobacteraceae bacterium]|jgi:methionyl-tRNA formyltransferase